MDPNQDEVKSDKNDLIVAAGLLNKTFRDLNLDLLEEEDFDETWKKYLEKTENSGPKPINIKHKETDRSTSIEALQARTYQIIRKFGINH